MLIEAKDISKLQLYLLIDLILFQKNAMMKIEPLQIGLLYTFQRYLPID